MGRKEFILKVVRWGLVGILAFMSAMLAARITTKPDCSACPSESGCTSRDNCPL